MAPLLRFKKVLKVQGKKLALKQCDNPRLGEGLRAKREGLRAKREGLRESECLKREGLPG